MDLSPLLGPIGATIVYVAVTVVSALIGIKAAIEIYRGVKELWKG